MSDQTHTATNYSAQASAAEGVGKKRLRRPQEGFGWVEECEDNIPHTETALRLVEAFNERWPYVQRLRD